MKKGFTLIELIVVIAVLALILLIVVPNVYRNFTNSRERSYTAQVKLIQDAAQNCVTEIGIRCSDESLEAFQVGVIYDIRLDTLVKGGYINGNISDPLNGGVFSDDFRIFVIRRANGAYVFSPDSSDLIEGGG